jgi:hypothetical protein
MRWRARSTVGCRVVPRRRHARRRPTQSAFAMFCHGSCKAAPQYATGSDAARRIAQESDDSRRSAVIVLGFEAYSSMGHAVEHRLPTPNPTHDPYSPVSERRGARHRQPCRVIINRPQTHLRNGPKKPGPSPFAWRIRYQPPSTDGGPNHDPSADHHQVLDDVLPFERRRIWDPDKDFMRKQDNWRQRAEHLHIQQ